MKNLIKVIIFIIIFVLSWNIIFSVLRVQKNSVGLFYDEPKKSLDVMYYGSSSTYAFYNAPLAYNEYGFTTGIMASDGEPFIALKYLSKEALKYQNPVVSIFDIDCIAYNVGDISEGDIRKVIDNMRFSKNKLDLTSELLKYYSNGDLDEISYYLPFLYYHSSWKDISMEKLKPSNLFKGSILSKMSVDIVPQEKVDWINDILPLEGDDLEVFDELIQYIKDNNIESIFVISKRYFSEDSMKRFNYVTKVANDNNIKVINFNLLNDFDVDYEMDFYNKTHLNTTGSIKYTLYLANYLKKNYNLPDHRNDKKFISWDDSYKKYKSRYKELTNNDFDEVLDSIKISKDDKNEKSNN